MITLSYSITPRITRELLAIDDLRIHILTTAIAPLSEAHLRWTAATSSVLNPTAFALLRHDWTGNPHAIQEQDIEALASLAFPKKRLSAPDTRLLLRFCNAAKDHPVIVAGVAFAALHEEPIGQILFQMFFAKYGYDCRGMLDFTPSWEKTHDRDAQYTLWLEAYTDRLRHTYETLLTAVRRAASGLELPNLSWKITKRQQQILLFFDQPTASITNREVARRYNVSQVTASRDLARLASLGFLIPRGKGRSTAYTKL